MTTIATATNEPGWPPLGLLVGAVRRRLKQAVDVRARALGLSPQQFWVVMALAEMDGPSLGALAARQHMDPPTASRVLTTLVRRGLARIAPHPSDRRRAVLALTPRGRALAARVRPIGLEIRAVVERGFGPEDKSHLRAALTRMLENLERFDPREGTASPAPRGLRRVAGERGGR